MGISLLRSLTGDAIGNFTGAVATLFIDAVPFDDKSLSDMGKVQIIVEFGGSPYFAGFNPAMVRRRDVNAIRFLSLPEEELEVFKECGLVPFDGEVIMRLTLLDQVNGELSLS